MVKRTQIMNGLESEIFEYECLLPNSKLQSLLRTLIYESDTDTAIKIHKISVAGRYNKICFQTNLSIDELAYNFSLTLSEIQYAPKIRANRKHNKRQYWMSMQRKQKNHEFVKSVLEISELYDQFNEANLIDIINIERAFFYNNEISQLINQNYFSKLLVERREFNLNEFLKKSNLTNIDIMDFELVLRKIGQVVSRIKIDNYKTVIKIEFYVRQKLDLILVTIALLCPILTEIEIDGEVYDKPQLPVVSTLYLNPNLGDSISLYFHADEIERFLFQLYDQTRLIFFVKKVSNIRIKCDSKSVKKLLTFDLYAMKYKLIDFLTNYFQSTYQSNDFLNFQFAFPWHCEQYKTWKNISIQKKNVIQYLFHQTDITSYFNLFELFAIEDAFYDINLNFSYYPYLVLKAQIVSSKNGNELNLNDIVNRFKLKTIKLEDFIKILKIYGKFIERIIGSEYLIEIPKFQRNKLKKILFYILKYCKNCYTIILDGIEIKNLVKSFKMLKINNGTNKMFNYEISNTCNTPISEIVKILDENEIFIEEINVQDFKDLNVFLFLKILQLPFVSKLTLSTYYCNFINWDFLLGDLKICKFSIQPNYHVTLYNNTHIDSYAGQFITKFVKFLVHYNFDKFIKLQILCYDCVLDNFEIFKFNLISEVGFGRMKFSYQHMTELSRCRNLKAFTFYDCQLLTDDLLFKLVVELEEWEHQVDVKVENCFITNAFVYGFAEHQIRKRSSCNYWCYDFAFTKFEFINCHITIDWAYSNFVLNETGDYIFMTKSADGNDLEQDVCDYEFYN